MQWLHLPVLSLLVTCGHVSSAGEKSAAKCKEYAAFVYSKEDSPVLGVGAGTNSVSQCGIVEVPLIIGGSKAVRKEFPHMALIGFHSPGKAELTWQCGGSVISEMYILTAAHCMDSRDNGPAMKVRVGLTNQKTPEESMQERHIVERIKHPDFKPPSRYNDIALLKLDSPLIFNADVRPACLQVDNAVPGNKGIAIGFGRLAYDQLGAEFVGATVICSRRKHRSLFKKMATFQPFHEGSEGSEDLMKVQLTYVSKSDCEETYKADVGGRQLPDGITPKLLCAGEMEGGKDTCQGDSGGPLQRVMEDPYCMYSIVGVTSFGKFCGFKNSPAIYTKVSAYLDWIEPIVWP